MGRGYKIKCAASSDFEDELISIVVKIIHKFFLLLSTVPYYNDSANNFSLVDFYNFEGLR